MRAADADPCLFPDSFGGVLGYVLVYMNDIFVCGATEAAVGACKVVVTGVFTVRDMGEPKFCLGMHVTCDSKPETISLGQRQYVKTILNPCGLTECNPVRQQRGAGVTRQREGTPLDAATATKYQEALRALLYPATWTPPDVSFAVGELSRHVSAPTQEHWAAAKAVMRYLKEIIDWRLTLGAKQLRVG